MIGLCCLRKKTCALRLWKRLGLLPSEKDVYALNNWAVVFGKRHTHSGCCLRKKTLAFGLLPLQKKTFTLGLLPWETATHIRASALGKILGPSIAFGKRLRLSPSEKVASAYLPTEQVASMCHSHKTIYRSHCSASASTDLCPFLCTLKSRFTEKSWERWH